VFGLWSLVPLFFVVLTALPMSYTWANDLLYRLAGSEPPPRTGFDKGGFAKGKVKGKRPPGERKDRERGEHAGGAEHAGLIGLNPLWARAMNQTQGWKSITAQIPHSERAPVSFTIDTGDGGQPQKRSTLVLERAGGAVIRHETYADGSAGRRLRMWSRFTHTGETYGLAGQTIAGLASAGGVMLVWTGISLSLRRFAAWRRRRAASAEQVEKAA
jgi:uncharacterized iron-regulated membrane protein